MDRFLVELKNCLIGEPTDSFLSKLIQANEFAFSKYTGNDGFNNLIHGLYLDDYLINGVPKIVSAGYYHWKKNLNKLDYLNEVSRYIESSEIIINKRSQLIIQKIKEKLY